MPFYLQYAVSDMQLQTVKKYQKIKLSHMTIVFTIW